MSRNVWICGLLLVTLGAACPNDGCDIENGGGGAPPPDPGVCDNRTVPPAEGCSSDDQLVPDTPTEAWRHDSTWLLVTSQGRARHRGVDMIYNPGQEQVLSGKFAYGAVDKDLEDEKVEIWIRVACGRWEKFGSTLTDSDGRVRFTVPADRQLGLGSYPVRMLVKGDHSAAAFSLNVWERGTRAVVSDIDGTISTQELDGVWTALDPDLVTARSGAAAAFAAYASKGYKIIYLTARPEFMTKPTRRWFADEGFPPGVFHLSESTIGVFGADAIAYKGDYLWGLAVSQGIVFDMAYGNTDTDLAAYLRVADPSEIALQGFDGDLRGSRRFDSWTGEADWARCQAPVN